MNRNKYTAIFRAKSNSVSTDPMSSNEIMLNLRVVRSETKLSMLVGNATSPKSVRCEDLQYR